MTLAQRFDIEKLAVQELYRSIVVSNGIIWAVTTIKCKIKQSHHASVVASVTKHSARDLGRRARAKKFAGLPIIYPVQWMPTLSPLRTGTEKSVSSQADLRSAGKRQSYHKLVIGNWNIT